MQDKSLPRKRPPTASKAKRSLSFSISILRELWKSSISYFLFDKNKEIKSFDMKKMVGIKEDFVCNCIGQPWEDICWQKIMKLPAFGNLRPWPSYVQQCTLIWHQIKVLMRRFQIFLALYMGDNSVDDIPILNQILICWKSWCCWQLLSSIGLGRLLVFKRPAGSPTIFNVSKWPKIGI